MAEGGYDPTDQTEKTPLIPDKGDDDDDDDAVIDWNKIDWDAPLDPAPEPEPDKRNPFEPAASSTPSDSERIALKTRTRLPPRNKGPLPRPLSVQGLIQALKPMTAW